MSDNEMRSYWLSSHIAGGNAEYVEALYEEYLKDPASVDATWKAYFDGLPNGKDTQPEYSHQAVRQQFADLTKSRKQRVVLPSNVDAERKQAHVLQLINAYRLHGHHQAHLDPLGITARREIEDLSLNHHHLSEADLDTSFSTESPLSANGMPLRDIIRALNDTYCGSIGIEYMHISDNEQVLWLQQKMESVHGKPNFSLDKKKQILEQLTAAEGLEKYLGTKYVGQKRFSLEGGDSLIPMMQEVIQLAGENKVREVVIGMAHRGRLNVLVNVLGKAPEDLFQEFEGKQDSAMSGDVKYHMGFSSDVRTNSGEVVHLAMAFNPSHLEIIAPVVQGSVRSRQRRRDDLAHKKQVVPVVIHGDAAFAGQGVVMETFNFSQARGYGTGGTVHIVINNQIGFTTSNPLDARSTLYCTDVAKMVQAPVIHVNGNDPEAVVFASQIAFEFRMRFNRDVVIDLVCYRRHGHNEADEPSVTQPKMYQYIRKLATPRKLYADKLIADHDFNENDADAMSLAYRDALDKGDAIIEAVHGSYEGQYQVDWSPYHNQDWRTEVDTTLSEQRIAQLGQAITRVPEQFTVHPVVKRLLDERDKMTRGECALNWGYAENMAYASLLTEGYPVRLSGQDSGRGTFAHRHAVLHDYHDASLYVPLQHIQEQQRQFIIIDSVLSEEAVLGFEYGYSAAEPNALVLWEAQFGDFANGAQVVIDQFISSGEQKWGRLCGLVMLLPHGYEGQGPEHSSARLERYMQLCAQHNMQVCVPTTPAQIFHLLRRQMIRKFRKPLIVMTPKSLLRHKLAVSELSDLMHGKFHLVIPEVDELAAKKVRRVVLCSGKVYYDLLQARRANQQDDVAIFRIEQLYPFPIEELKQALLKYPNANDVVWCQEEPQNQGAWFSSQHNMRAALNEAQRLRYVGREFFAAPAVGSAGLHAKQQQQLVQQALGE